MGQLVAKKYMMCAVRVKLFRMAKLWYFFEFCFLSFYIADLPRAPLSPFPQLAMYMPAPGGLGMYIASWGKGERW